MRVLVFAAALLLFAAPAFAQDDRIPEPPRPAPGLSERSAHIMGPQSVELSNLYQSALAAKLRVQNRCSARPDVEPSAACIAAQYDADAAFARYESARAGFTSDMYAMRWRDEYRRKRD